MMGVPNNGPANVFCDNNAVVTNATIPESTLKWKHNSIAYHKVQEVVAAGIIRIAKEHTDSNLQVEVQRCNFIILMEVLKSVLVAMIPALLKGILWATQKERRQKRSLGLMIRPGMGLRCQVMFPLVDCLVFSWKIDLGRKWSGSLWHSGQNFTI
jgi:hypothetical protein